MITVFHISSTHHNEILNLLYVTDELDIEQIRRTGLNTLVIEKGLKERLDRYKELKMKRIGC
jgi:hypothetical protein